MRTELTLNGSNAPAANYLTWAPVGGQVRLVDPIGAAGPVTVTLRNQDTSQGGQVVLYPARAGSGRATLQLTLPLNGTPVDFFVGGQFGRPSLTDGDAAIAVTDAGSGQDLSVTRLMVRIRKNANTLTVAERNRFRGAMATLNDRGLGRFSDFRNIHTAAGSPEAHGRAGFLPWHRSFLLDLERTLQQIDPSVTIPYWRFDQPAPTVFTRAFMGVPNPFTGTLEYDADNPLQFWVTDNQQGISRRPRFNTQTQAALSVLSENQTLALGNPGAQFELFRAMEDSPHGFAHTTFNGAIASISTAARDPLFFMLHANVDRLWAKWQWFNGRFDASSINTYPSPGQAGSTGTNRIGHNLEDTMWPWNQVATPPRPPAAPGGTFPPSVLTDAPGHSPEVRALIDYQGVLAPASYLGFDYDDVPFEF